MSARRLIYCVFVAVFLLDLHQSGASMSEKHFTVVTSGGLGSDRLGPGWNVHSLASCVLQCMMKYSSKCQTFMYNFNTGFCTPGSFLKSGVFGAALAPTTTEGDLYAQSTCDTSDDFTLLVSSDGTLSACAMVSNFSTNYNEALNYCFNLGAHLYVSRSIERFNILPAGDLYTIGLTDLASEGTFVWQDNGNAITPSFRSLLFPPGEPSNSEGLEDCVVLLPGASSNLANDYYCPRNFKFVCERPWFK